MKIRHELTPYFCELYRIDSERDYPIEWIDPRTLLVSERLDLVAKIKYIESRESGHISPFVRDCYVKHIEAFSFGTFHEGGSMEKDSIEKYFTAFDELIDTIKESGFDVSQSVIPVGRDNILLDGAHRVAVAIYFNMKLPVIRLPEAMVKYDAGYFRKRLLDERCLDYLLFEYAKLKGRVHLAYISPALYPKYSLTKKMKKMIAQDGKLLYTKKIALLHARKLGFPTTNKPHPFTEKYSKNQTPKFYITKTYSLYIFETETEIALEQIKAHCREIFHTSRHTSCIIADSDESIRQLEILLDDEACCRLTGDNSAFRRFHKNIKSKMGQVHKRLVYRHIILVRRALKYSGLFPVFQRIYRKLRKST